MSGPLQTELLNFVAQGKKRNSELKQTAEKSLGLLEALPDSMDLSLLQAEPEFVSPFLLACTSSNAKSCASALQCLQIIVNTHALAPQRLNDFFNALLEATHLGIAIQLKVLQLLPLLLAEYFENIKGDVLAKLLKVCAELNRDHKASMVSNTAYATLQQLITSLYDRVDEKPGSNKLEFCSTEFELNDNVYDAARILLDLCEIAEKQSPQFLQIRDLPTPFTLELLELTLTNHSTLFQTQPVFRKILSGRIVPLLLRLFSESSNEFALIIRVARIFYLSVRKHIDIIAVEAEVILNTLAQTCKSSPVLWKQVLCLEVFQGVFLDSTLLLQIFSKYRDQANATLHDIVDCFSSALVHSNIPMTVETSSEYISKAGNPKVPCIDMLDKTDPPVFNHSYFFYLIMVCINALSDGLTKLSSSSRKSGPESQNVIGIIDEVQNPLTNCFTALLGASMDIELFKTLVKSVQRIAHVCGIMGLPNQRDEYILILTQHSYIPEDEAIRAKLLQCHIFCIRALFNLGVALGNKLGKSWSLIVDVIGRLAQQIRPGYVSKSGNFFDGSDDYRPVELSLRRMLDQTVDLEDEALNDIISALLSKPDYIYLAAAEYLVQANAERFFNMGLWKNFSALILIHIENTDLDTETRLAATRSLDASIVNVMNYATDGEELKQTVNTLYAQVQVSVNEVQLHAVSTMNVLLDQFFAKLSSGWEELFQIISFVAQSNSPPDLYKTTFEALELICHDFLENLPYSCIFDLTLCLDQFSRQHSDLNTSFTATSLFWSICDYLIKTQDEITITEFNVDSEQSLIAVAKNENSPLKQYSLWMLAEIKLAHIASEPQHQIKTGACQIFFRLFEAHAKKLPDVVWLRCLDLVFPEIMKVKLDDDPSDADETYSIIINGLGSIYASNVARSVNGLVQVFAFFTECSSASISNVIATLQQVSCIVDAATRMNVKDTELSEKVWSYWINQNPNIDYDHRKSKMIYDSLKYIVDLFPKIDQFMKLSVDQIGAAVKLLVNCAKYNQKTTRLSNLQERALTQLQYIWDNNHTTQTIKDILFEQLGELSVYCFSGNVQTDNFLALSNRSQDLMAQFLQQEPDGNVSVFKDAVTIMKNSTEREQSINLFLHMLGTADDRSLISEYIVEGGRSIISGGLKGDCQCEAIDRFTMLIEDDDAVDAAIWSKLLECLVVNSLLYYRGYYFSVDFISSDQLVPKEIFGSIELEVPNKRYQVAYHCLDLLVRLSNKQNIYAELARAQYTKRAEIVLLQNIGDSKLRGLEPMSTLLRNELLFILHQLLNNKQMVPPHLKQLLLQCISTRDHQVVSTIQDILI